MDNCEPLSWYKIAKPSPIAMWPGRRAILEVGRCWFDGNWHIQEWWTDYTPSSVNTAAYALDADGRITHFQGWPVLQLAELSDQVYGLDQLATSLARLQGLVSML